MNARRAILFARMFARLFAEIQAITPNPTIAKPPYTGKRFVAALTGAGMDPLDGGALF